MVSHKSPLLMLRLLYCLCSCLQLWLLFYLSPGRSSSTKSSLFWCFYYSLAQMTSLQINPERHSFYLILANLFTKMCCLFPCLLHSVLHLTFAFKWCCVAASALQRAPLLYFRFHSSQAKSSSFPVHLYFTDINFKITLKSHIPGEGLTFKKLN